MNRGSSVTELDDLRARAEAAEAEAERLQKRVRQLEEVLALFIDEKDWPRLVAAARALAAKDGV